MTLAERMKNYEYVTRGHLYPKIPVIIRVDGKAFHTLTKKCHKPFDIRLMSAMSDAATAVAREMQGCKCAYVQSDEVTFLLSDTDTFETQGWFNYNISKMVSISASLMSVHFNRKFDKFDTPAVFDSRAFNIPEHDIVNMFLWRAMDWKRNSLQMFCRYFFSHKELRHKKQKDMHEMLHRIGGNWAKDLSPKEKNGTFVFKGDRGWCCDSTIKPTYESINTAMNEYGVLV